MREACYHARYGKRPSPRFGQRVTVLVQARRGVQPMSSPTGEVGRRAPRNVLIHFPDGAKMVTSIGCLRWKCDKHP